MNETVLVLEIFKKSISKKVKIKVLKENGNLASLRSFENDNRIAWKLTNCFGIINSFMDDVDKWLL